MFKNQGVRQETQREDVIFVFLGWLFKLVIKNQSNISKLLQKCKKCSKGLLKYLMIILRGRGGVKRRPKYGHELFEQPFVSTVGFCLSHLHGALKCA